MLEGSAHQRSRGVMSIHKLNRLFFVTTGVMVALLAVFAVLLFFGQRELKRTTSRRYASYLLADELRQSSDDLTRMARTFVLTGDARFERMYWEILAIRNGEAPRPPETLAYTVEAFCNGKGAPRLCRRARPPTRHRGEAAPAARA